MNPKENEVEENLDLPEIKEGEEDTTDWKAEAQKLREKAIAQRERTKTLKAELKEHKEFREKLEKEQKPEPKPEKSNEVDYGKLAFLEAKQISHPDDQKVVMDEAKRLNLPLTDVLAMEHIKGKLQKNREVREVQDGMPTGGNRAGTKGQNSVDYWLAKGGLPADNQELAEQVVEARMKKESSHKFSDIMFNE